MQSQRPIYLDHNATTPLDSRVRDAMLPYLGDHFGNASSGGHAYGWQAQMGVRKARAQVAELLGCQPSHVVFTSGATESNNLAILGLVRAFRGERPHILTQATEHKAVLEVCEAAREWGAEVTVLPVNCEGLVTLEQVERATTSRTVLCSIMMANNEIGTLQPIAALAELCRARKIVLHTDAAQSAGKVAIDLRTLSVDLLSLSAHKMYGPKGVGALINKPSNRDFELKPIMFGGEQEKKLRPGTLNVAGIVGFGEACALAAAELNQENARLRGMQQLILKAVCERFPQVKVNGPVQNRLCNNLSFSFPQCPPDEMALGLSGLAYSSGSACNSGNGQPSYVLKALGMDDALAKATLRLGLGRQTTSEDAQVAIDKLLKMLDNIYTPSGLKRTLPLST